MIQKLRAKFTAAAMLSLFIVLAALMGAVNLYNYRRIAREADETLAMLSQNQGRFPAWMVEMDTDGPGGFGGKGLDKPGISPELPFESRYFSVDADETGAVNALDLEHVAAVNETLAAEMAGQVLSSGRESGFAGSYRYAVSAVGSCKRVLFLDCARSLGTFRTFLWASVIVSLIGLAAVFVLTLWLSGRFIRPVAESYEKQKRFITDAGHEIKTPITIIDADAEVLSMELPDSEWIEDIRAQTKRLADLTNDLIFLSKMDEGGTRLQRIDFPLSDMVSETAQSFRSRVLREKKELRMEIEPMLTLCGDEKSLRQLVNILLDNAVKYSPAGGEIGLLLEKTGRGVHLAVTNTCESLPEGELNDLFERFYRAERSRNSATGGHGLGLAIARAVVAAHKGRITASAPGGTALRFDVFLPEK